MQQIMIKTWDKVYPVQQQILCCWTIKKSNVSLCTSMNRFTRQSADKADNTDTRILPNIASEHVDT